jgi:hypothetical protein
LRDRPGFVTFEEGRGNVVWNKDIKGCEKFRGREKLLLDHNSLMSMDEDTVRSRCAGVVFRYSRNEYTTEDSRFVQVLFPSSSRELSSRTKITTDLAMRCWGKTQVSGSKVGLSYGHMVKLLSCWGIGGQCFSNIVIASTVNPECKYVIEKLIDSKTLNRGLEFYIKLTKNIHDVVRRSSVGLAPHIGVVERVCYHYVMYLPNLAGRFYFAELTATEAIKDRAVVGREQCVWDRFEWSSDEFDKVVRIHMVKMAEDFSKGLAGRKNWSVDDFIANLTQFGTSGSSPKVSDDVVDRDGEKLSMGRNKMFWLNEKLSREYIYNLLSIKPSIHGTGADKYEAGKQRMLLPGPIGHWLLESLALMGGESRVYRKNNNIALELRNMQELIMMTQRLATVVNRRVAICSDFADHNILHTFERMKEQWLLLASTASEDVIQQGDEWYKGGMRAFVAAACRWAAAALDDVAARANRVKLEGSDREGYVKLVRGLWSGWRSTTFINTTFNEYYQRTTMESYKRMYGEIGLSYYHILGDDMAGEISDEWSGLRYLEIIDKSGLDAQAVKQMLSNERMEFLRLMYESNGMIMGNVNRAVSGLVSGDGQTSQVWAGAETAYTINEAIHTLIRRSCHSGVELWRYTAVMYWATVTVKKDGNVKRVGPSMDTLQAARAHGGLGCSRFGVRAKELIGDVVEKQISEMRLNWLVDQLENKGSKAAMRVASHELFAKGYSLPEAEVVILSHASALIKGALPNKVLTAARKAEWAKLAEWYDANRHLRAEEVICDGYDKSVIKEYLQNVQPEHCKYEIWHPTDVIDEAVAIALGPLAAVPQRLQILRDRKGRKVRPEQAVLDLGGAPTATRLQYVAGLVGVKRMIEVLNGKFALTYPSSGVIPTTHSVLVSYCVVAELRRLSIKSSYMDNKLLQRIVTVISSEVEQCMLSSIYWSKQMHY